MTGFSFSEEATMTENQHKKYEAFGEIDGDLYRMEADDLSEFDDFIKELDWFQVWDQECGTPVA